MKISAAPLKYRQILEEVVYTIRAGHFRAGDKLPTENELSRRFGASRSTVIRALRGIEEQGLITRRQGSGSYVTKQEHVGEVRTTTHLGLIKGAQSGRYVESVADQIQNRLMSLLQERGSGLVVHTIEAGNDPIAVARKLVELHVSGVFMLPLVLPADQAMVNKNIVATFSAAKVPVVLLDSDFGTSPGERSGIDVVRVENRYGGFLQTQHLFAQGLRRIVFLGVDPPTQNVTDRHAGYLDAMSASGIEPPPEWTCQVSSGQITEEFVRSLVGTHHPEGIVCKSDEFAALLMRHMQQLGIRIPEDIRLVGFDDRPIASLLPIALTTIRQPIAEIAETAYQLMQARLAAPQRAASRVEVAGELIVRRSSVC